MMARALALNGAHRIYIVGRRKDVLEEASRSVSTNNIFPIVGDVTSKEALASVVSTIQSEVGYINLLIANSGILGVSNFEFIFQEIFLSVFWKLPTKISF